LVLAVVGDSFNLGDEICGVVLAIKHSEDVVSIWTKNSQDKERIMEIRNRMKKALNVASNLGLLICLVFFVSVVSDFHVRF
jgi:translation initiation factor 4E